MKRLRVLLVCLIVALLCWYPGHYVHCSVQSASGPVLSAQDGGPQATEQKEEVAYDKVEESGRTDGQSSYDVGVESERASLEDQPAGDASKEDEHKQTVNPEEQPVVVFEQQQEVEEVVLMVEEVRSEPEQPVTEPEPAADPQQAQDSLAASHTHQPEPEVHAELPPSTSTDQASASTSTSSSTTTTTSTAAAPKDPIPEPQAEPHSDAPATPEHAAEVPGGAPTSVPSPDAPSSDVENMSITLGRGTGTNADLPPPLDLVVPDPDQSGNASLKPEEPQVVDSSGSRETDPSVPSKEDIPTFDEWKKKVMEVEKEKSQSLHTSSNGNPHPVKKVQKNFKNNYASVECGAKILSANSEAKSTSAILMENMDIYMLNPCSNKIWFVIELCEPIQVKQLDIANFELFSSTPKDFLVSISDRYPTNKWIKLGTFHARDQRTVQSFPLDEQLYAKYVKMFIKYMKVELLSHFGSEHFCPLSLFRVFGTSMVEEIDEADSQYPAERLEYPDEEFADDVPGYIPSEDKSSKNLLGSATNAILDIVNNIAANVLGAKPEQEGGAHIEGDASSGADNITETASEISVSPTPTPTTPPVLEVSEAEQAVPKDDQAAPLPETPAASALPEGGQIVTLVQDEEEEQSSQSTVTLLEEEEEGAEEASSSSSSSAPPETEEEQCGREAAQRESLFYCAHLSTLSCLASLQEKLCRWCSVTLALQRQRKDRQHRAAARGAASRRGSGGGGGGEESAAVSHVAPPPAQQTAVPAPTPTLAQEQPPAQPASERLPQAEPAQGERPSATDAMDVGAGHQGEAAGAAERTSDPPILLEPSRTSTLPPHSFSDGSLAKPTPTQDIPERPTGEPQDQQQQQRPGYLEQVPKTQAEGHRTSSSSPPHLHPTPTATSAGLTSTPEALSPETDSPRLDPPLDSSSQQPLLPTHTQPADIIAPPTELPAPPPPESADSGRPGVEELPHHRPLTPAPPPPPQQQQQEVPEAPAPHADHRVEEAVEELLLSVPAATGHHRTATDFYAELQNTADLPHGNGNGNLVHGSNQKESVFMRLNNRIKALEMNMSLSSRYLEELSQRYRKQMEEMQRAFNKTIIKLQNTSRIAEEQDQKQTESIQVLQNQLENVTKLMLNLSATVIQLQREVSDRQSYLVVSLVLCLLLGLLLCMQCCRGSSNHSSTSTAVPMTNHYPSPKRCFSSYDDMSLKRRVSSPLVRSKSFQMTATDVGPDDLYIVEPLRFSPEKKKKRCKVKASEKAETLKASAITAAPAPISNGAPKCNGTGGGLGGSYPHSLHFLPCPDIAELSTCSSRDAAAWSEVSSEGSSTVSDEPAFSGSASSSSATAAAAPYSSDLCNGHLPTRSKAEKRSFKRRRSKQADQQQQQQQHSWNGYRGDEDDELLPVPILEELIKGKQELGVGMGTFRVQTVTGHV
ncbi:SUN domain-containing ossification factor isoform X5 [Alosa pseudoharengus]|uniref:SUN domain-containing ossification factor isoform X5 n=1 Tax=Alosa pseudoharengus TaxID=34774 RepID=UPI003F8C9AEC